MLVWGNGNIASSTTPRYLSPGFDMGAASTQVISFAAPDDLTLEDMFVHARLPGNMPEAVTFTVRVNGVVTALAVSLPSDTAPFDGSNTVDSVAVNQGDLVDIEVTKPDGAIGQSPMDVMVSLCARN